MRRRPMTDFSDSDIIQTALDIPLPSAGRKKGETLFAEPGRELSEADIEALRGGGTKGVSQQIVKVRETHHQLARLVAQGKRVYEISAITGFSPSYISALKNDPSFKELISYYSEQVEQAFVVVQEKMAAIGVDVLSEVHDRVLLAPEKLKFSELIEVGKMVLDRTGNGPTSKVQHAHAVFDASSVAAVKEALSNRGFVKTLNLTAEAPSETLAPPISPDGDDRTLELEAARSGGEGEGADL